jgi:hypothetical protein
LLGDISGNKVVTNTDVSLAKSQVAAPVTASNFRDDVTANGVISNTDSGHSVISPSHPRRKIQAAG